MNENVIKALFFVVMFIVLLCQSFFFNSPSGPGDETRDPNQVTLTSSQGQKTSPRR